MEFLLYTINLTSRIFMDIRFLRALQASFVLLVHISGAFAASTQVGNTSVKCVEGERQSLLAFKQGFVDPNNSLSSWGNEKSQKECCNWEGVGCNESGHVNSLSLTSNGLKGALPKSLELCQLSILFLNGNYFSGRLDDFISAITCANESLQYLNLAGNQIGGPIPDLSQFSSLETLYLGWNQLNGTLSDNIGKLSSLVELSVSHNSLEGVISETHFLKLSKLQLLDLSSNRFVFNVSSDWVPPFQIYSIALSSIKLGPTFPIWLQTQKTCYYLDISNSEISDTIPSWFQDFTFVRLNLSHNHITGEIPYSFPSQKAIPQFIYPYGPMQFDLSSNLLEGSIPPNLTQILALDLSNNRFTNASSLLCPNTNASLEALDLSNNQLSGMVPDCWTYFEQLIFLNLANNSFFGNIPTSMGSLIYIRALHLGRNRFVGEIPLSLNKCTELRSFDVGQNDFSGLIPSWIGERLKNLRILSLRSNMFSGSLPASICQLSQVQVLDLSRNSISGSLLKCLSNLSALANETNSGASILYSTMNNALGHYVGDFEDIASMIWKGVEYEYKSTLGLLKSIDLSSNLLTGEIPSEMMNLFGLISLNISRNKLSGKIPPSIGYLKLLDFLDLSRNYLSGRIPSELSHIDRLSVLDLSYNNLSGKIPLGTQLQSFDASAYAGNVELCGDPLPKCPTTQIENDQHDANSEEDGQFFSRGFFISLSIGFGTGFWGVCSLLFLNKSWRSAYFKLMISTYDKVFVLVAINMAKLQRRNRVST